MKKAISLLLALALCLCLVYGAAAEVTLESIGVIPGYGASWISNTDLLKASVGQSYRVVRIDGSEVNGEDYTSSMEGNYGFITVKRMVEGLNTTGVIDENGASVIPCEYGDIDVLSPVWAVAIKLREATDENYDYNSWSDSSKHYIIEQADIYNLQTATCLATLARADFKDADVVANVINIENRATGVITSYDEAFNALGTVKYSFSADYATPELSTYRENGRYGLKDSAGNIVMEPSYVQVNDFKGEYATVSNGEKTGLIDRLGNQVIAPRFDNIRSNYYGPYNPRWGESSYEAAGYFAVINDGKLGFVNLRDEVTCEPRYSEKIMDINGASALYTDMENNMHIYAADGTDTVVGYEKVYCLDGSSGMLLKGYTDAGYDIIDWHGNVVIPADGASYGIDLSGSGQYLTVRRSKETELFRVNYGTAEQSWPADEGNGSEGQEAGGQADEGGAEQGGAEQSGAPGQTQSGLTDAKAIVGSVIALLEADAATNKAIIDMLLGDVLVLSQDVTVQTMVTSVRTLLNTDAAANAATAVTLLRSVETLL